MICLLFFVIDLVGGLLVIACGLIFVGYLFNMFIIVYLIRLCVLIVVIVCCGFVLYCFTC